MSFSKSLKKKADAVWEDGYRHPFVQKLGDGTLDKDTFKFYLLQDYQYLLAYAKIFALGAVKADEVDLAAKFTQMQKSTLDEMQLHRNYMQTFGIAPQQMDTVKPSLFNRAYTASMLAAGQTGGVAEILAAVFPCAWTYADYATRLAKEYKNQLDGNFYKSWIDTYASEDFSSSFAWFYPALDALCQHKTDAELCKIEDIFISSVEFEYLFWDTCYKQQMSYAL